MANNNSPFSWQNGIDASNSKVALNLAGVPPNPFSNQIGANLAIANTPMSGNNINMPANKPFMPELEGQQQSQPQAIQAKFNPNKLQLTEQSAQSIFNAYINGTMDEQARAEYENDIQAGKVQLPFTVDANAVKSEIKAQKQETFNPNNLPVFNANQKQELPKSVVDAYNNGTMDATARTELERDLKDGVVTIPKDYQRAIDKNDRLQAIGEEKINSKAFKNNIQDYVNAPEFNNITTKEGTVNLNPSNFNTVKGMLGSFIASNIDEKVKILENNFPDIKFTKTKDGSAFFQSPTDGKYYGINKGKVEVGDIVGGALKAVPYALLAPESIAGGIALGAGAEGANQAVKKATGGNFDTKDIVENAVLGGALSTQALNAVGKGIKVVANKVGGINRGEAIAKPSIGEAPTIIDIPTISKTIDNDLLISTIKEAKDGSKKAKVELKNFTKADPEILVAGKDLGIQEILSNKKIAPETKNYIDNLNFSAGAMATRQETLRLKRAEEFNVPITKGEATRDRYQLQLETEDIGKSTNADIGGKYETFKKQQENSLQNNFDDWIDEKIGAKKIDDYGAGGEVKKALNARLDKEKAKTTQAYNLANSSKEANQKVATNDLISFLNDKKVEAQTVGSVLDYAKRKLIATGGAIERNGELVAQDLTRKDLELIRRSIGNEAQTNATNMHYGTALKKTIDKMTEAIDKANNGLYQKARMQKQLTAQKFENKSIVADLLAPKRTKGDAKIADEKVVQRVINAPVDDIKFIRNLLVNSGEEGKQAWKEVQGGVIRRIRDKATSGVKGELSADKLNKTVTALTKDEKLTAFLGKKGSEALNDFNQLVKDIKVLPTGISNASGTAHALQRMLQGILSKSSKYLRDTPILRIFLQEVEDKKLQRELGKALYYKGNK